MLSAAARLRIGWASRGFLTLLPRSTISLFETGPEASSFEAAGQGLPSSSSTGPSSRPNRAASNSEALADAPRSGPGLLLALQGPQTRGYGSSASPLDANSMHFECQQLLSSPELRSEADPVGLPSSKLEVFPRGSR